MFDIHLELLLNYSGEIHLEKILSILLYFAFIFITKVENLKKHSNYIIHIL